MTEHVLLMAAASVADLLPVKGSPVEVLGDNEMNAVAIGIEMLRSVVDRVRSLDDFVLTGSNLCHSIGTGLADLVLLDEDLSTRVSIVHEGASIDLSVVPGDILDNTALDGL